jgi:hypothetical protein
MWRKCSNYGSDRARDGLIRSYARDLGSCAFPDLELEQRTVGIELGPGADLAMSPPASAELQVLPRLNCRAAPTATAIAGTGVIYSNSTNRRGRSSWRCAPVQVARERN